ncbi:uroporphyrinogen-III synthase [Pseudoalteromonas luteoviolacea]|uniref:uroporphyrinogen-III C-methyltransferase n=1 Tax=Pseudoalteromonas luteoviolacea TaxID=43657 RepID=UPI001B38981B|nr:uroporphyrinogen-III synthase [Pseudoalteromonas luteoviolacea]
MKFAITRPQGKGETLATELAEKGILALCTPVLTLKRVDVSQAQLIEICEAEILIFISQDAVLNFAAQLEQFAMSLPASNQLLAVGQQTADAIQHHFARCATVPKQQDSEGLVALPELQHVDQARVALIKGRGGRAHIAKTLKSRQALLSSCSVYERLPVKEVSDDWLDHWMEAQIDGIVVTSNAAVDAIFNCHQPALLRWLETRYFVVVSERTAQHLKIQFKITDKQIALSAGADNQSLLMAICKLTSQQGSAMTEKNQEATTSVLNQNMEVTPDNVSHSPKTKLSKTAVVALLVALSGIGATAGLFLYDKQQEAQQFSALAELQQQNQQLQVKLNTALSALNQLQSKWPEQEQAIAHQFAEQQSQVTAHLQQALLKARQQVGGALSSELRSLARYAEFKAVSERDYLGSVLVLKRLQQALSQESGTDALLLAISSDIAKLQAQPQPNTEAVYMELAGLLAQIDSLPLKTIEKPKEAVQQSAELSTDVNDWRANLSRSWQKIRADFLTIRQHDKPVIDPLLDAHEQQLIRSQLRSYLQQAQSAFLDGQSSVYYAAIEGAEDTLDRYFKLQSAASASLAESLNQLKRSELGTHRDVQLATPAALKEWLQ